MPDPLRAALGDALGANYVLGEELSGGMSRVFVATDSALGRRVVIKTLGDASLDGPQAARFRAEILLAAALQHPNIVPVLSAGTTREGIPWYTMPFVEGMSLRQRLAQGALPLAQVVTLLRDVARALGAAHRRGVIHRDIKPDNIFIADGVAMVSDFGVAKAADVAGMTSTGMAIGTPAYMAPEQIVADPAMDARADLYALGLVGWELLTGRHPFADRPSLAMVAATLSEPVPSLAQVAPGVPPELAQLVSALLEKEPDRRPVSADVVVTTCTMLLGSASSVHAASGGSPAARAHLAPRAVSGAARRNRWLLAGSLGLVLAAGAALLVRWPERGDTPPAPATPLSSTVDWGRMHWLAPVTALRVAAADTVALAVMEPAVARVRSVTLERGEVARTPDSLTVLAHSAGGTLVFSRPGGASLAAIPLGGASEELQARAAGVLAIVSSEVLGDWTLPRGAPPRIEQVERFLAMERVRLLRQAQTTPVLAELYDEYDQFVADVPDWAAPMLLIASRMVDWPSRERYVDAVEARRAALTDVEQLLIELFRTRDRPETGGQLAVLRELARTTRFAEFARAYAGVLGNSRQLTEAAAVLWSVGPGAGREHLPYWNALINFEHLRGAHERALAAADSSMRESGMRVAVRWRRLRALAALRRVETVREEVARLAPLPRDPELSVGWVLTSLGDEFIVHGDSATGVAYHAEAMRWFDALPAADRTTELEVERAQLESRRGEHATAAARIDSLRRIDANTDLLAVHALIAVRAKDHARADSLLALWFRSPVPRLGSREVQARAARLASGALPGDSAIVAARVSALRDDPRNATAAFRRAMEGLEWRRWSEVAHFDPDFARIRAHPDFRAVLGAP